VHGTTKERATAYFRKEESPVSYCRKFELPSPTEVTVEREGKGKLSYGSPFLDFGTFGLQEDDKLFFVVMIK
jgi:hypothetical protein